MTKEQENILDLASGIVPGSIPWAEDLRNASFEEKLRRRQLMVMDEQGAIHEPSDAAHLSAFTSQFGRAAPGAVAGAVAGTAAIDFGTKSGILPAITEVNPLLGGVATIGTGLVAGGLGAAGADKVRRLAEGTSADDIARAQEAWDRKYHPVQSGVAGIAAQALSFKLPSPSAIAGILGKPAQRAALKGVGVNAGINAGITAGSELAQTGTVDPWELGKAALAGGLGAGGPRAVIKGLGNTIGVGAENARRAIVQKDPSYIPLRTLSDEHPGIVPGSGLGKFAAEDPATAEALLNREADKRNYMGMRNETLNQLNTGSEFLKAFPNEKANYPQYLRSAMAKRTAAYRSGYAPEYRGLIEKQNELIAEEANIRDALGKIDTGTSPDELELFHNGLKQLEMEQEGIAKTIVDYEEQDLPINPTPDYTPQEAAAIGPYDRYTKDTRLAVRNAKAGTFAGSNENYVPEQINQDVIAQLTAIKDPKAREQALSALLDSLTDDRQRAFVEGRGHIYDPEEARNHFQGLITSASGQALTQLGKPPPEQDPHNFNALTRNARRYSLFELGHESPIKQVELYGAKFADSQSMAQNIRTEAARRALGIDTSGPTSESDQLMSDFGKRIKNNLTGSKVNSTAADVVVATQRLGNALKVSLPTGVRNYVQGVVKSARDVLGPQTAYAILKGNIDPFTQLGELREAATRQGNIVTHPDDLIYASDEGLASDVASNWRKYYTEPATAVAKGIQKWTFSDFVENLGRVRDFAVGKQLAKLHMEMDSNPASHEWLTKYSAGTNEGYTPAENIDRMASNYVVGQQSSYDYTGLPLGLVEQAKDPLTSVAQFSTRLNRYGIDTALRMYNDVIRPAERGDARPLISIVLASLAGREMIKGFNRAISANPAPGDAERTKQIEEGAPPDMQGLEKTLQVMEAVDAAGIMGSVGGILSTAAKRANGADFDYLGTPSVAVPRGIYDAFKSLLTTWGGKGDTVAESLRLMKEALMHGSQTINAGVNAFQSPEDTQLRVDTQRRAQYERMNAPKFGPALISEQVLPFMAGRSEFRPGLHQYAESLRGQNNLDPYSLARTLDPESRSRQLSEALKYPGLISDPKKAAEFESYISRVYGPEALKQLRIRATKMRSGVVDKLRGMPILDPLIYQIDPSNLSPEDMKSLR